MSKGKVFFIIFLLLLIGAGWFISTGYYSSGDRAGTISKFSERGYIFKTWEGQLMEGGYSGETGTLSPRLWDFSTTEDSVVNKIRQGLATGERVTLIYQEKFIRFPWNGDTEYIITDVKFLPRIERRTPERVPEYIEEETVIDTNEII